MHRLDKENYVYGEFTREGGRLTFRTGDPALIQRLERDRAAGRESTVCLLKADPSREFTGALENATLVKVERPQEWAVAMIEGGHVRPKRQPIQRQSRPSGKS